MFHNITKYSFGLLVKVEHKLLEYQSHAFHEILLSLFPNNDKQKYVKFLLYITRKIQSLLLVIYVIFAFFAMSYFCPNVKI